MKESKEIIKKRKKISLNFTYYYRNEAAGRLSVSGERNVKKFVAYSE